MGNEIVKQAKALNKMGDKMFKKKQYNDAIQYYIESVKLMKSINNTKMAEKYQKELDAAIGKKAEELNNEGDAALKNKDFEKAIETYEKAWKMLQKAGEKWIKKKGNEFQKELNKSKIQYAEQVLKPAAESAVKEKNWESAVSQYKQILKLIPKSVDAKKNKMFLHDLSTVYERWADEVNAKGDTQYKSKDYEAAIESYAKSVRLIEQSDNEKKKKNFRKELSKAFQEHAQEVNNVGDRLWKEKNFAKAADIYAQSVKIAKEAGNEKLIERFSKEMFKAYSEYAKQINTQGDKLFKEKKWEAAADIYVKSVEVARESNDPKLIKNFTKEYEKALEKWAREINSLGDTAMKEKKFDEAMKKYQESVAIITRTRNKGLIKNFTSEYHNACIKLADEINRSGDEKYKAGDYEAAFKLYDKSVQLAEIAENPSKVKKYGKERNKALQKMNTD
ncbi:tetratricopeptide repeat protein [Candidatus Harpocratesius sp.]